VDKPVVECVPNFSEGKDPGKVDEIVKAITSVPGVLLLDRQSDADHNRTVVTFAGAPEVVVEAAVRGAGKAAELIDLNRHTGVHPRIGALDVLPFVPLQNVRIEECAALAVTAGEEIWKRFHVPVYLYGAAARRPERRQLAAIRRGQFEGLREEVLRHPERRPDIGGPELHPTAGACAAGARKILIAYNIQLATSDVAVAQRIARKIRSSSGGLPAVKAMGVFLRSRNQAQVSMNLTDFEQTAPHEVFAVVKREAERLGYGVAGSEIIGLIPRRAIEMAKGSELQLENFHPGIILEDRLAEVAAARSRGTNRPPYT